MMRSRLIEPSCPGLTLISSGGFEDFRHDPLPTGGQIESTVEPVATRRVVGDHVVRFVDEGVAVIRGAPHEDRPLAL